MGKHELPVSLSESMFRRFSKLSRPGSSRQWKTVCFLDLVRQKRLIPSSHAVGRLEERTNHDN